MNSTVTHRTAGYAGYQPRSGSDIHVETIIGATRDIAPPEEKPYFSGKDHIQGYKGYIPKRIIRRESEPEKVYNDRPSSSEGSTNPIFAKLTASQELTSSGNNRPEWLEPERATTPERSGPKPIPGYSGYLSQTTAGTGVRSDNLGTTSYITSKVNIIAHDQESATPLSTTDVKPLVGYTGYVPRRVNADLAGKSMWRALEEQGAAPDRAQSPSSPGERRSVGSPTNNNARPNSSEAANKPPAITAIPGYSGHVPNKFRSLDGRFQVAPASIPTAAGPVMNGSDPSTEYDRDLHVSGYTGYVPRDWSTATGKSRWSAVTNSYREPGPEDVMASRGVYNQHV